MIDLAALDGIDWASLRCAYGPCTDAPDALRVLALEKDPDSDDWADAMDGVVFGHFLHQGDIYPVTPHVVPFLIAIADEPTSAARDQVASAVGLIAQAAAGYALETEDEKSSLGRATQEAIAAHESTIESWLWTELDEPSCLIAEAVPSLGERLCRRLEGTAHLAPWHYLVLGSLTETPAWAVKRAERDLSGGVAESIAAALLLQRQPQLEDSVARRVDELLAPAARPKLEQSLSCRWELPDFHFPLRSAPTGQLVPCKVVFAGPSLLYVQHPTAGRVLVRVGDTGLKAGDTLSLELAPTGAPRAIAYTDAAGKTVQRTL